MDKFKFSWNPFEMIPDSISYNLKVVLISLIALQFLAFVVWMVILVREYLQAKRDKENGIVRNADGEIELDDLTNEGKSSSSNRNKKNKKTK